MKTNNRLGVIQFENTPIRVIYNEQEAVEWLCLNDLLKILDRTCMMDNGQAMRLCKTSFRIPFKDGGRNRWGVKPHDVHNLLRTIRPENSKVGKICDDLQVWVNNLPTATLKSNRTSLMVPSGDPVVFTYQDKFPTTFKSDNGRIYVNATQMAKGFGKLPTTWLTLSSTSEFRAVLVRDGKSLSTENQVMTTRGHYGSTWIEEPLAMEFARWLSPEFSDWCNERIKELATKGYVTMPIKREHRSTFGEAIGNFPVPQNFEEALMLAAEQQRKIREDEPKVAFYDEFVEERDHFRSSRIADELDITTVQLNRFLAEQNIIKFEGYRWVVQMGFRALQTDVPYMWEKQDGKMYPTGSVKRWTKAGREYIIELWKAEHPELYSNRK